MTKTKERKQTTMDLPVQELAALRAQLNLRETKHPYHHKTADGTIVEPDPALEYFLSRLSAEQRRQFYEVYAPTLEQEAQAPKAVPVDRMYYGLNPYEGLI